MSHGRFFKNPFLDLPVPGKEVVVYPNERALDRIKTLVQSILQGKNSIYGSSDAGVYLGPAGVAYTLWYLYKTVGLENGLQEAVTFLKYNLKYVHACKTEFNTKKDKLGFLIGHSGVYAVGAVIASEVKDSALLDECLSEFTNTAPLAVEGTNGSDELLVGRAGYVSGALWLRRQFGKDIVPLDVLHTICGAMLASGEAYSQRVRSPCPLMYQYYGTEYLGAAHGLCTILQMFISVPGFLPANDPKGLVAASIDFLATLQDQTGNFPCAMDEAPGIGKTLRPESEALVHWCHGAPGTIYLYAKAYLLTKKEEYLKVAIACGECIWQRGLLRKGPGICHGVAGNAYAFLILYRLTKDKKYIYWAQRFAEFMESENFLAGSRRPDCPFSLYEGLAGTACFLADLTNPDKAAFPFLDVFEE